MERVKEIFEEDSLDHSGMLLFVDLQWFRTILLDFKTYKTILYVETGIGTQETPFWFFGLNKGDANRKTFNFKSEEE
jgi:hypothetical protein